MKRPNSTGDNFFINPNVPARPLKKIQKASINFLVKLLFLLNPFLLISLDAFFILDFFTFSSFSCFEASFNFVFEDVLAKVKKFFNLPTSSTSAIFIYIFF